MPRPPLVPYHVGLVVADIDEYMQSMSASLHIEWARIKHTRVSFEAAAGPQEADMRVVHSVGVPHIELVEAVPDSVWQPTPGHGWHHVAFWSSDLPGDVAELEQNGYWREVCGRRAEVVPSFFAYLVSNTGYRIELVDVAYREEYERVWIRPSAT
jgi:hypothetical protein